MTRLLRDARAILRDIGIDLRTTSVHGEYRRQLYAGPGKPPRTTLPT